MAMRRILLSAGLVLGLAPAVHAQLPAGTAFTYQGRLEDGGSPATGSYDFEFRLFDGAAGGAQVGGTVERPGVVVAGGLFTVDLDFGPGAFTGSARWLEVAVRPAGGGAFTTLSPRQRTNGAPYGIHALSIPLAGSGTASTAARSDHDHAGAYAAVAHHHLGQAWNTTTDQHGLVITNNSTVASGAALRAVHGGTSGASYGIQGISLQPVAGSAGVYGLAADSGASAFGVFGETSSSAGRGVFGLASASTGTTFGVYGAVGSTSGWGLFTPNNASVGGSLSLGSASAPLARLDVSGQGRFLTAAGTPPLVIPTLYASGATVANLSADRLDGLDATAFSSSSHTHAAADITSGAVGPLFGGTGQTSWATGDLLFASAPNTLARLPAGSTDQVLSVAGGGVPAWADADDHDHIGQTWSTGTSSFGLDIVNNAPTFGAALRAFHGGTGITATAINGINAQPLGGAVGVRGDATDPSAINYGIYGFSASSNGRAVAGVATATTGAPFGVYGQVVSPTGWGVYTPNNTYVGGNLRLGAVGLPSARLDVVGQARIEVAAATQPLLIPTAYAAGANVANLSADLLDGLDSSAFAPGVHNHAGETWSATSGSYGLNVVSTSPATGAALRGVHSGAVPAFGVEGINNQSVAGGAGVFGVTTNTSLVNYGVLGRSQSTQGIGVRGEASVAAGDAWGVYGTSFSTLGRGVVGSALATSGATYGVYGSAISTDGWGLYTPVRAHVGGAFTVAGSSVLTGNVAIGGAGTSARLSIVPSSSPGVRELEFTGGVLQAVEVLANNNMLIGTATVSDLQLQTGLATRLFISGLTGLVGIGTGSPSARLDVEQAGLPAAEFNRTTSDGAVVNIAQDGIIEGSISVTGTTVSYNAFTGSHYAWTGTAIERGMLVSLSGDNRTLYGRPGAEPIYGIAPTTRANDAAVLGAYLGRLEPGRPEEPVTENPHLVAAVGNGELWVVDTGGDIAPGDDLVASATPGHAMRDDDRFAVSHVVARAAEPVRWRDITNALDGVKRRRISVLFESHVRESTAVLASALAEREHELAELRRLVAAQSSRLEALETFVASANARAGSRTAP